MIDAPFLRQAGWPDQRSAWPLVVLLALGACSGATRSAGEPPRPHAVPVCYAITWTPPAQQSVEPVAVLVLDTAVYTQIMIGVDHDTIVPYHAAVQSSTGQVSSSAFWYPVAEGSFSLGVEERDSLGVVHLVESISPEMVSGSAAGPRWSASGDGTASFRGARIPCT